MYTEHNHMTKATEEFSRFAYEYDSYSTIQSKVASRLIESLGDNSYKSIIDIGCGSGAVYKNLLHNNITFDSFTALDASCNMLEVHPDEKSILKMQIDFGSDKQLDATADNSYDLMLSSSALQWSSDLDLTLSTLSNIANIAKFAIFTSGTFETLHRVAGISSPIHSTKTLVEALQRHYSISYEVERYRLYFESTKDMFRYIKKSGVSGGEKKLGYRETKHLMAEYPLGYLEFEVIFVEAIPIS